MNPFTEVVLLGTEGSGVQVYGTHVDNRWVFDAYRLNLDLDQDLDEIVRVGGVRGVTTLDRLIPRFWPAMTPFAVHQDLRPWFAQRYEQAFNSLPKMWRTSAARLVGVLWTRLLGDPTYQFFGGDDG